MDRQVSTIRAAFEDAKRDLQGRRELRDPPREQPRSFKIKGEDVEFLPGKWPGAPFDRLPPDCPVIPLGYSGLITYFVNSRGNMIEVAANEWGDNLITLLFAETPHYKYWAWPRFGKPLEDPKTGAMLPPKINGMDIRGAKECLIKAAVLRGTFDPLKHVRGRGGWTTREAGEFLWHAGDRIYRVRGQKLDAAPPGEIDGMFYPAGAPILAPWSEPVTAETSPAARLLQDLRTWNWERPEIDPILALGQIGVCFAGGALKWRAHTFVTGDRGTGKTTLKGVVTALLGSAIHSTTETSAAGIYQRLERDCLPVAVDELENRADASRPQAIIDLARVASSEDGFIFRGGTDHKAVTFTISSAFFFFAINPPPMEASDRSRMAILNLHRLKPMDDGRDPVIDADADGRMLLRQIMQGWADYGRKLEAWRAALWRGGLDSRGQDTYGTLLAMAHLLLGDVIMSDAGFDLGEPEIAGKRVGRLTAEERAEQTDNWRDCVDRMLNHLITDWKSGEKPTIGHVMEQLETGLFDVKAANDRLNLVGLAARQEGPDGKPCEIAIGARHLLAVPVRPSQGINRIFDGTKFQNGGWNTALRQAPGHVVVRDRRGGQNVKINRATTRVLWLDLAAYDRETREE